MLTAVVAHPPRFGAKVVSFDAAEAQKIAGVRYIVELPTGVAVVASSYWTAKKARDLLKIQWDDSAAFKGSSPDIMASYKALASTPGTVARNDGDVAKGFAGATKTQGRRRWTTALEKGGRWLRKHLTRLSIGSWWALVAAPCAVAW